MTDEQMDTYSVLGQMYKRLTRNGWEDSEAVGYLDSLAHDYRRRDAREAAIREACEIHGMLDLVKPVKVEEWDAELLGARSERKQNVVSYA